MNGKFLCLASACLAVVAFAGCNTAAAPAAAGRERILKANTDPSGKPNFVSADVNANAVVTCTDVHGDTVCYVKSTGQLPTSLKKGETLTVATAGKVTLSCNGSGPEFCEVSIKD